MSTATMTVLRLDRVCKTYGEGESTVEAVRDVSLDLEAGKFIFLMGPSGSGKTTLLMLMGCLLRPTMGSVHVFDQEVSSLSEGRLPRIRREKIGFIFQFFNLLPTLTAIENVALPLHLAGRGRKKSTARARELLAIVGLEDRLDHLPDELSGGEQQRVAMARALALDPPLILADEPTGNLDSESGRQVLAMFKKLQSQFKTTVLMVTHDSTAAGFCDRIIRMQDGMVIGEAK